MKYFTRTLTLTLTLAAAAPLLNAQTANQPPRGPMPFTAFDQDGNGVVTQQEFETTHAQRMAARAAAGAQMRGGRQCTDLCGVRSGRRRQTHAG